MYLRMKSGEGFLFAVRDSFDASVLIEPCVGVRSMLAGTLTVSDFPSKRFCKAHHCFGPPEYWCSLLLYELKLASSHRAVEMSLGQDKGGIVATETGASATLRKGFPAVGKPLWKDALTFVGCLLTLSLQNTIFFYVQYVLPLNCHTVLEGD